MLALVACVGQKTIISEPIPTAASAMKSVPSGMPAIDPTSAVYEVPVNEGVSYQDVVDSLKSVSEGMNFVNPANFPIGDHIKMRGIDPQGVKEVHALCNLTMGTYHARSPRISSICPMPNRFVRET